MGHALGLRVVAEGAETPQHLAALRALGCELAQGYYLGRPLPAGELESFLSGDTRLADSGRW
jgi:EAL domain-containing protein (putative c-di-GMP-specific phosphodiesterase class I)